MKGVASAKYIWRDTTKLSALHVGWAYGWSPYVPASTPSLDSVPMVSNAGEATPMVMRYLSTAKSNGSYKELLGFNEPDNKNQANMTPQQAIALWPLLESTGLPLGSPAPANVNDGWLSTFMGLANTMHYRVNFITLHYYVDFTNPQTLSAMISSIKQVYQEYKLPIWITEIGSVDTRPWGVQMQAAPSDALAVKFMANATTQLSQMTGVVARYAWFTDNCASTPQYQTSSLYDSNDQMTPLGIAFAKVPMTGGG